VLVSAVLQQQQQSPANSRLSDILAKVKQENVDDKTLEQLVLAMTLDPNANVRLRALDALYAHADRQMVRAGVLTALQREPNPLVQLELIDFIATAQDPNAAPVLEQISADESANANVRDAAKFALAQL
jgi:HEAT repeat protein